MLEEGMTQIAKDIGVERESLYKAFVTGVKPGFLRLIKVIKSLGLTLQITFTWQLAYDNARFLKVKILCVIFATN